MMVAQHLVSFNSRDVCLKEFFGRDSPPVGGGGCEKTRNDSRGGGGGGRGASGNDGPTSACSRAS